MSTASSPTDPGQEIDRRAARNAAKLGALVRDRWGFDASHTPLGTGAALVAEGMAFVLLDGDHGLGAALAWARRANATQLHIVADEGYGVMARQAAEFAAPIHVWRSEGRTLIAAEAEPFPVTLGPPDAPEMVAVLLAEGLEVVVEGDRFSGEYRGLEVVRIVRALDNGEPIFEVGVGRFDRELTTMMHGDMPDASSVARVVEQLRVIRRPDAPIHPLASLVPERWLRATLVDDPGRIGCDVLTAAPTPTPRDRLRDRGVAAAVGTRDGAPVVVACTVGVDLDAVALAADARAMLDPDATLLLALPQRDVLAVTEYLVGDLARPAEIAAIDGIWKS